MRYIPNSPTGREEMLGEIGVDSIEELFAGIPDNLRLQRVLDLPPAMTEPELLDFFDAAARRNRTDTKCFLGAGVYPHHIPVVVDALISRSEFFTSYTPYQAEIAQGTLQAIFEFQTYITQLTGMDVANASLYDGSTALAEALDAANFSELRQSPNRRHRDLQVVADLLGGHCSRFGIICRIHFLRLLLMAADS